MMTYYRLALDSRTNRPDYHHGILRDELDDEFHRFWSAHGGTEAAWLAFNSPLPSEQIATISTHPKTYTNTAEKDKSASDNGNPGPRNKQTPEGDWERMTRQLPSFDLSDFSGKTWRQNDLRGKVIVIVSWATWCAPCRLQDELVQKFYEKVKGRVDLAVLSFNVDQNPGEVVPFMRRQKYTFPVLAASSYQGAAGVVPRTWIIDPQGDWRWVKNGYDESKTYAEFERDLLNRIQKAKGEN